MSIVQVILLYIIVILANIYNLPSSGCKSRISDGKCKLIGSECWCHFESSLSKPYGAAVCGYPANYSGVYYSLSLNSSHSPLTIIKALDKKPHPDACKIDNYCLGNARSNFCWQAGCTGARLELGNDLERWNDKSSSFIRCVNMEGKNICFASHNC